MDDQLQRLRVRHKRTADVLGVRSMLRTTPRHDGSAHVELRDGCYHYVVTERDSELERRVATDENEILYWLASDLVFDLACDFELRNRTPGQDTRRLLFEKEVELLSSLDSAWAKRKREETAGILKLHPYDDLA
jgi:hypothetical protein